MKKNPNRQRKVQAIGAAGRFSININGHNLSAVKGGGPWVFICFEWPDLVAKHAGSMDAAGMVADFTERALADAVTIEG